MDIFFHDPDDVPLPPAEVRIRQLAAQPYADGRRVRIYLEISPFQKRPSAEIHLIGAGGEQLGSVSIIETVDTRMELTMHLRGAAGAGWYTAHAELYYLNLPEDANGDPAQQEPPPKMTVDQAETSFQLDHAP